MDLLLMLDLQKKAKSKKDGVYTKKRITYSVKKGYLRFYVEYGKVYECAGIFSVYLGEIKERHLIKKELMRISNLLPESGARID